MSSRSVCTKCGGIVNHRTSKALACVKCDQIYHRDCTDLTVKKFEEVKNKGLKWICHICSKEKQDQIRSVSMVSQTATTTSNDSVDRVLCDISDKLDLLLRNQNVLEKEMMDIKTCVAELQIKISSLVKVNVNRETVTENVKRLEGVVEQVGDVRAILSNDEKAANKNKNKNERTKKIKSNKRQSTYAEKVKMSNNDAVLMVKPKITQDCNATESDLKKRIDPTTIKFSKLKKMPNGCLAIECVDLSESEAVKELVSERMSDKYDVTIPELKKPRVKILGINDELEATELTSALKSQNSFLEESEMTVINFFKNQRKSFTAVVELDPAAFEECMRIKKVKILWSSCHLVEDLNVFRCFKCHGFNHKLINCTNKITCKKCAGSHDFSQCTSDREICVNCKVANEKFNLRLNVNHAVTSEKCSVYKKRREAERRKIKYSM